MFDLIKETIISESNYERLKKALAKQSNNLRDSDVNISICILHLTLWWADSDRMHALD